MFASPFEFCKVCNEYVLLDATQRQCAREHQCRHDASACLLQRFFTGIEFSGAKEPTARPGSGKGSLPR